MKPGNFGVSNIYAYNWVVTEKKILTYKNVIITEHALYCMSPNVRLFPPPPLGVAL